MQAEVVRVLQSPEVSKRFGAVGVEPQTNTPPAFAEMIKKEIVVWRKVVTDANIRID
jgi:tripartite-type tricarboxylate transporter receptor subunit TctC